MDTKLGPRHLMKDMQDLLLIMRQRKVQKKVNDTIGTLAGGSYSNKDIVAAVILEPSPCGNQFLGFHFSDSLEVPTAFSFST